MFVRTIEEIIYSTEDKLPQPGEIVLVLRDDKIQDFHTQWFRKDFQKIPFFFEWEPAEFRECAYGFPRFARVNMAGYGDTLRFHVTHWKYMGTPPEELTGVEFS